MADLCRDNRYYLYLTDDERNEIDLAVNKLITLRRLIADKTDGYSYSMSIDEYDEVYDDEDFESIINFLNFLTSDDIVVEK